jgi:hypothetical protein
MFWEGVTMTEQRQRFLEDYQLNYYLDSTRKCNFGGGNKR